MGGSAHKGGAAGSLRVFLAVLCVLLVALLGTVQAAHFHADNATTHANCSLCATAHVTVQMVQTPAPAPTTHVIAKVEILRPAELPSGFCAFSHFTRPPPADFLSA